MTPQRAVFLDRDGTINENRADHVKNQAEFVLLPGVIDAICALASTPLAVLVISNQSVVNRGLASLNTVHAINQRLVDEVSAHGGRLDGVYICPHTPDEDCDCRKPRPGLLIQARAEHNLELSGSYVVGDAATDVELALAVGCIPVFVLTGRGRAHLPKLTSQQRRGTHVAGDLQSAVQWILQQEVLVSPGENDK